MDTPEQHGVGVQLAVVTTALLRCDKNAAVPPAQAHAEQVVQNSRGRTWLQTEHVSWGIHGRDGPAALVRTAVLLSF